MNNTMMIITFNSDNSDVAKTQHQQIMKTIINNN